MKTNRSKEDAPLDNLLHEWKVKPALPPRFGEQVWRRIELADTAPASTVSLMEALAVWISAMLPRPALVTAYVTVLIAVGASVGWRQARQTTARVTSDLSARYVQAVDPYQSVP